MKDHKRRGAKQTISASSMGKALVLLATSCAALSTGRPVPTRADLGRSDTSLNYRSLNDYEMMTRLPSRSNDVPVVSSIDIKVATPQTRRIIRTKPVVQDEQIVMDEYLEYVEKRYSRINRINSISKPTASVFPTKMISTIVHQTPVDNEALQALGLTGLISERLRTRLHAPREFRNEHESAVNFFHYFSPKEAEKTSAVAESSVSSGRLAPHVSLSFAAQFALMMESLRKILTAYMTSLKVMGSFFARAVPAILEKGGLQHSVKMMSVASLAVLLMFRPLFKGFMKQA